MIWQMIFIQKLPKHATKSITLVKMELMKTCLLMQHLFFDSDNDGFGDPNTNSNAAFSIEFVDTVRLQ